MDAHERGEGQTAGIEGGRGRVRAGMRGLPDGLRWRNLSNGRATRQGAPSASGARTTEQSEMAKHVMTEGHAAHWEPFIVEREQDQTRRRVMEALTIHRVEKGKGTMNTDNGISANQQALARLGSVKWGSEFIHEGSEITSVSFLDRFQVFMCHDSCNCT